MSIVSPQEVDREDPDQVVPFKSLCNQLRCRYNEVLRAKNEFALTQLPVSGFWAEVVPGSMKESTTIYIKTIEYPAGSQNPKIMMAPVSGDFLRADIGHALYEALEAASYGQTPSTEIDRQTLGPQIYEILKS